MNRRVPALGFVLSVCIWSAGVLHAQPFHKEVYSIPVSSGGVQLEHPCTGGLMNPMHQFIDLDGDGDLDLFLYDFNDGSVQTYRNLGTPQAPFFRSEHPWFELPQLITWFRLHDINGDARADLLTGGDSSNSIAIYANTGTPQTPQFSVVTRALRDSANNIVAAPAYCISALMDIDCDGDQDYFSVNPCCGTINYYQNIGGTANFRLAFRTGTWQNIVICPGCGGSGEPVPSRQSGRQTSSFNPALVSPDHYDLHGLGNLYFADLNRDNKTDMFYGDLNEAGILFYRNSGTQCSPHLDSLGRFPTGNPVLTAGFNQPSLVDIDGDGDLDMFTSILFFDQLVDNFWFLRNDGDTLTPSFTVVTKNYLPTLDVGRQSSPVLVDIDADGDPDLYLGDLSGNLTFYRNAGTATVPSFVREDSMMLPNPSRFASSPTFADIDGDMDKDLFVGHFQGNIEFYRNVGSPSAPIFQRQLSRFDSLNVGFFATPTFIDIDGDGDLDLLVGKSDGRLSLYRNDGWPQTGTFVLVTTAFQGIDVGDNAKPQCVDVDGDGDFDLLIGASDGSLTLYRNDGPPGNPVFVQVTNTYAETTAMRETAPAAGDVDGDGDVDLFVGNVRGGLEFYRNLLVTSVTESPGKETPWTPMLFQNYPNPFNPSTVLVFTLASAMDVRLDIIDVLGREVETLVNERMAAGTHTVEWDASRQSGGMYYYRLRSGSYNEVKKMILLK